MWEAEMEREEAGKAAMIDQMVINNSRMEALIKSNQYMQAVQSRLVNGAFSRWGGGAKNHVKDLFNAIYGNKGKPKEKPGSSQSRGMDKYTRRVIERRLKNGL